MLKIVDKISPSMLMLAESTKGFGFHIIYGGSTYGVLYGDGIDLINIDLYDLLVDCFRTGYINLTLG